MKQQLLTLFEQAIGRLQADQVLPDDLAINPQFERTRQPEHGDFATNLALTLAKPARRNPRELAQLIVDALPADPLIVKVEIAGPGFINLFVADTAQRQVLLDIFDAAENYGLAQPDSGRYILVEFVSANPTGPLHVGHGRGAAYGDALARLLRAAGNRVESEYYVNDAGRQMDILGLSVWLRYLQHTGQQVALPGNAYQGDYVSDMARDLQAQYGEQYILPAEELAKAQSGLEDEAALDALISLAKLELGEDGWRVFFDCALQTILQGIETDLTAFGVDYDTWFSERSLFDSGKINAAIEQLKASGDVYEKGGAWWFRSTAYGDEKDRVVIRDNGQPTYFASDIAYHKDKMDRGFDECINIWGSDHHGYIPRVKASLQALGLQPDQLTVLLVQFAVLYRGGEKVSMSTRSGQFVTLSELCEEVGSDAARFFYIQRKSEQHMDFDLDLAKSQSNENPLYYVQYAHARICSIFRQATERCIALAEPASADLQLLSGEHERTLLTLLQRFGEVIENAARDYEPHQLTYYLRELATAFHAYYNSSKFLDAEPAQRDAILALCQAARQVLANGLSILGVNAPDRM
ncbi:MAG: arginine--tRNA ligase [Gammaproteobacteria bacterium]|nr:arginine--tRNA ligase [Gammaproteobacteria bacterium]